VESERKAFFVARFLGDWSECFRQTRISYSRMGMKHPFFKMGFFCQNTPEMGLFDFRRFSQDRINSQKTGFETRVFGNTRFLSD